MKVSISGAAGLVVQSWYMNFVKEVGQQVNKPAACLSLGIVVVRRVFIEGSWGLQEEQRRRQQRVAEITEMIHVASLMHDDVIDSANTRRGLQALNSVFGNKVRLAMTFHQDLPARSVPCHHTMLYLQRSGVPLGTPQHLPLLMV